MKVGGAQRSLIVIVALALSVCAISMIAPSAPPPTALKTPNPAKVPWSSLGLQEKLVYYDPWYSGAGLPIVVLATLVTIPTAIAVGAVCYVRTRKKIRLQRLGPIVSDG